MIGAVAVIWLAPGTRQQVVLPDHGKMEATQAMCLSPIGNPAYETIRGVRFAMLGRPGLVAVLVTHAALEEIEAPQPAKGAYLARFEKHRDKFEQIASSKYLRGQVEITGPVIVNVGDLA